MSKITIDSFRGGQANDKNAGQVGAFWNAKNINYRENTQYIELAKKVNTAFTLSQIPRAITLWGSQSSIYTDIVVFTSNGVYTSAGQQSSTSGIINVAEANGIKYCITNNKLYEFSTVSTQTLLHTFTNIQECRPVLNFYGDLIIGDGTQLLRYNKDGTLIEWTSGTTEPVLGGLNGTVRAITRIGQNIYVWCDNGSNTTVYYWDGLTNRPTEEITYTDKSVKNVALLANSHYWWSSKSAGSIKEVLIGESYRPQVYVKSKYPELPLDTNSDNEKNKMAIGIDNSAYINAIETISDIVYLPGYGRIFGFGSYFPGDIHSFNSEFTFEGTHITAMSSGSITGSGRDAGGFLIFSCLNGANYDINVINLGQDGEVPASVFADSGMLESMEYTASVFHKGEDDKKYTIPFELPDESCSIKVYEKRDRATNYTLVKELTYANYPGYQVAEIRAEGKWRTKQFKFELITTDTDYSPKLYIGFTNETVETGKI